MNRNLAFIAIGLIILVAVAILIIAFLPSDEKKNDEKVVAPEPGKIEEVEGVGGNSTNGVEHPPPPVKTGVITRIHTRVINEEAVPFPGAKVFLWTEHDSYTRIHQVVSDGEGNIEFVLDDLPRISRLSFHVFSKMPKYDLVHFPALNVEPGKTYDIDAIVMVLGKFKIHGHVRDMDTREPVPDIRLECTQIGSQYSPVMAWLGWLGKGFRPNTPDRPEPESMPKGWNEFEIDAASPDANTGYYAFENLAEGNYFIYAFDTDGTLLRKERAQGLDAGKPEATINISLSRAQVEKTGWCEDEAGSPVEGVEIRLRYRDGFTDPVYTRADGWFNVRFPKSLKPSRIYASKEGFVLNTNESVGDPEDKVKVVLKYDVVVRVKIFSSTGNEIKELDRKNFDARIEREGHPGIYATDRTVTSSYNEEETAFNFRQLGTGKIAILFDIEGHQFDIQYFSVQRGMPFEIRTIYLEPAVSWAFEMRRKRSDDLMSSAGFGMRWEIPEFGKYSWSGKTSDRFGVLKTYIPRFPAKLNPAQHLMQRQVIEESDLDGNPKTLYW